MTEATVGDVMKTTVLSSLYCSAFVSTALILSAASVSAQAEPATQPVPPSQQQQRGMNDTTTTRSSTATQRSSMSRGNQSSTVSDADRTFIEKAAKSGMKEVTVSQATLNQLSNPELRDFAQTMISDHTNANQELMSIAQQKGVMLPQKDMDKQQKMTEKWSKKTEDLDKDYISEMVDDHEEAVELFEKATRSTDSDISTFAQKTLPKLQHHLMMAKNLKQNIGQQQ